MPTIETVESIDGTDAFTSFEWEAEGARRFNVIYGWNGSGKSTLARAVRLLEKDAAIPDGLESLTCRVKTTKGILTPAKREEYPITVRVFNGEFVRDNLSFNESGARPIVILGEENVDLAEELKAVERRIKENADALHDAREQRRKASDPETTLTACGQEVVKQLANSAFAADRYNARRYNRGSVRALLEDGSVKESSYKELIIDNEDELRTLKQQVQAQQQEVRCNLPDLSTIASTLGTVNILLQRSVHVETIERLEKDQRLARWIRDGYDLHEERAADNCEFCGNVLPEGLLQQYGAYYTDEVKAAEADIADGLRKLDQLQAKLTVDLPDSAAFFTDLASEFRAVKPPLESVLSSLREVCAQASERLGRRVGRVQFPDSEQEPVAVPVPAIEQANDALAAVEGLCREQATRVHADRDARARDARRLELHTIAVVLRDQGYFAAKHTLVELEVEVERLNSVLEAERRLADEKRAILRNTAIARHEINNLIAGFLGSGQIVLEEDSDGEVPGYKLMSRGRLNRFPSEGEKSIVGLAYFITKLREEGCDPEKTVVVLDDPVDSQDSNFLFRTASLLRRKLEPCSQVFFLTHNADFFNLLRDWLAAERYAENSRLYWIEIERRGTYRHAVLRPLPTLLRDYKSEYHYLASRLIEYGEGGNNLEAPLVGNIGRKVLEYFGSFKWACKSRDSLTNMIYQRFVADGDSQERALGDAVLKFLNEHSHGRDFGRPISATAGEARDIAVTTINFIRRVDPDHFEALSRQIRRARVA
jgi:wobble nucleotide-excising tRNase